MCSDYPLTILLPEIKAEISGAIVRVDLGFVFFAGGKIKKLRESEKNLKKGVIFKPIRDFTGELKDALLLIRKLNASAGLPGVQTEFSLMLKQVLSKKVIIPFFFINCYKGHARNDK